MLGDQANKGKNSISFEKKFFLKKCFSTKFQVSTIVAYTEMINDARSASRITFYNGCFEKQALRLSEWHFSVTSFSMEKKFFFSMEKKFHMSHPT